MTANMTESQYMKYYEARQSSFANKAKPSKFREWLLKDCLLEIKPNAFAIEVLQYLAYETVAEVNIDFLGFFLYTFAFYM